MTQVTISFSDIISVVTGVATNVREELIQTTCGDVDRFCPIVPGEIAWDHCDCGLFAQTITETYPSNSFPSPASDDRQTACGPNMFVVNVSAVVIRCAPNPPDNATAPTCAALEDGAVQLECDRYALRRGVTCYLRSLRESYAIIDYAVSSVTATGPQGGCVGIEMSYRFAVAGFCCG